MSMWEEHLEGIINIYQYTVSVDHHDTFSKHQLQHLLKRELPNMEVGSAPY